MNTKRKYLLKRIITTNLISILIIGLVYLWVVYVLSHANSFWDLIRGKEVYETTDTIPPTKPFLNPIPKAVQDSFIDVTGSAEPGVKVKLYVDQTETNTVTADNDGKFSFTHVPIGTFSTNIYVKAVDDSNNESERSSDYTVIQDTTPPEYKITKPKSKESTYKNTGHNYTIEGTTEPDVTVVVNEQYAIVNQDGHFSTVIRLQEGGNTINFSFRDPAGNESTDSRYVNFQKIK